MDSWVVGESKKNEWDDVAFLNFRQMKERLRRYT